MRAKLSCLALLFAATASEREFILDTCQGCHTLNLVARSGGDFDGWSRRLVRMIRAGAPIARDRIPNLARYLAKAFPVRPRPPQ